MVLTSKRGMVLFSYYIAYGYVYTYVNSKFGHDPLNGQSIQNIMSGTRVARKLVTAKFRPLTTTRCSELICFNRFGGGYHRDRLASYYGCHLAVAFIRLKAILFDSLNIPVGLLEAHQGKLLRCKEYRIISKRKIDDFDERCSDVSFPLYDKMELREKWEEIDDDSSSDYVLQSLYFSKNMALLFEPCIWDPELYANPVDDLYSRERRSRKRPASVDVIERSYLKA